MRRISIQGAKFSGVPNCTDKVDVVIVNAGPVSRSYYEGVFDSQFKKAPTCWSVDTQRPAAEVPEGQRQSSRCMDCSHNIRGSGAKGGRACRFHQRLAVVEESDFDTVYQLQVPASSIFGKEASKSCMPLQAYAKFLSGHGTPSMAVVTRISFDENSSVPKLFFYPRRALEEEELGTIRLLVDRDDVLEAITTSFVVESLFNVTEGFNVNSQSGDQNG
jgi:hypothetical protein